tara:strand:- start:348 stop:488 length:141 start_codon:yes stop_codon:yes gene_type:complete
MTLKMNYNIWKLWRDGGDVFEIPIIPIECILKYNILYNNYNIYREA